MIEIMALKEYKSDGENSPRSIYGDENGVEVETPKSHEDLKVNGLWNKGVGVLEASKGYAADFKRNLGTIKERLMDKLSAVPLPADALDNPRQSVEMIIKDMTHAAQGFSKDAFQKIKSRLIVLLPSLSANQTGKIVDDVEREMMDNCKASDIKHDTKNTIKSTTAEESDKQEDQHEEMASSSKSSFMSPTSAFSISMEHLKRPFISRSRL